MDVSGRLISHTHHAEVGRNLVREQFPAKVRSPDGTVQVEELPKRIGMGSLHPGMIKGEQPTQVPSLGSYKRKLGKNSRSNISN